MSEYSYFIIGEEAFAIRCAELVLQSGQHLIGCATACQHVETWCRKHGIPVIVPGSELQFLRDKSFDYLLSIANSRGLESGLLMLPEKLAINFHDGPLPEYAGLHVTSWAIIHGEREYGVTWHIVSEGIDDGAILKEKRFALTEQETALSLNAKCHKVGLETFVELLQDLKNDSLSSSRHRIGCGKYFARTQRPVAAGTLQWQQPATKLQQTIRGLEFGSAENPLIVSKLFTGKDILCAVDAKVVEGSESTPGEIVHSDEKGLRIATADGDLLIRQLHKITGEHFSCKDSERPELRAGYKLPALTSEQVGRLNHLSSAASCHERYWCQILSRFEPCPLPYLRNQAREGRSCQTIEFGDAILDVRHARTDRGSNESWIVASFATFMARLNSLLTIDLAYSYPTLQAETHDLTAWFSDVVPLQIAPKYDRPFAETAAKVDCQIALARSEGTFTTDIFLRYPQLKSQRYLAGGLGRILFVTQRGDRFHVPSGYDLICIYSENSCEFVWQFNTEILSQASADRLQLQYLEFLTAIGKNVAVPVCDLPITPPADGEQPSGDWGHTENLLQTKESFLKAIEPPKSPAMADISVNHITRR